MYVNDRLVGESGRLTADILETHLENMEGYL